MPKKKKGTVAKEECPWPKISILTPVYNRLKIYYRNVLGKSN